MSGAVPIVDVHCHVFENEEGIAPDLRRAMQEIFPWDCGVPTPEVLLEQLDQAGVQYAVLQAYDMKELGLDIPNAWVAEALRRHPDRFICGYASTDPVRRGVDAALGMLKEAYGMGLRGLKLHPVGMQFRPDDRKLYPLYERCIEYGIPVAFHLQPIPFPGCRLKFCEVGPIDELAYDLPALKIHICHFGKYPFPPDALDLMFILLNHENVYTDTSAPMPMTREGILNTLGMVKQLKLTKKSMFGTDFPVQPQSWWVECVDQIGFTPEEKADLMGGNALRFVGRQDLLP
ncbi:MAG: amidohydrolase family protein [bacterium]